MPNGKYIVIDGLASAEKSALIMRVVKELQAQQLTVRRIEGWDSYSDLTVQTLYRITEDKRYPKSTQTTVLLDNATFAESLETIRSSLAQGITCVVDRSYLAALVTQYYGQAGDIDYNQINELVGFAYAAMQPDVLLVVDTPVTEELALQTHSEVPQLERLRAGYLWETNQRNLPVVYITSDEQLFTEAWKYIAPVVATRTPIVQPASAPQSVAEVLAANPPTKASSESLVMESVADRDESANQDIQLADVTALSSLARLELVRAGTAFTVQPVHYKEKDENDHFRFFIPSSLKGKLRSQYIKDINKQFEQYAELLQKLAEHLRTTSETPKKQQTSAWRKQIEKDAEAQLRYVLPVAATKPVTTTRAFPPLSDMGPTPANEELQKLAEEFLPQYYTGEIKPVSLVDHVPHNELDAIPEVLYSLGDAPYSTLRTQIQKMPYQRKTDALRALFANKQEVELGNVRYTLEIVTSFGTLLQLSRRFDWREFCWQPLSPRLGYDTPATVESAGLADVYDDCFDRSLALYSTLQSAGLVHEAQYAVLQGHKQRWLITLNASDAHTFVRELQGSKDPELQNIVSDIVALLSEVHPLVTEYAGIK